MQSYTYSREHVCSLIIINDEVFRALLRSKSDKIFNLNDIINRILKTCFHKLTFLLTSLFQICITLDYHSRVFRETHSITLKKSRKSNYSTFKTYSFIAFLNTLEKILKTIIANKIIYLTKKFKLFSNTQMSARNNCLTKSTLELLVKKIHAV